MHVRYNEANMKKNVGHSQTQRRREVWAWGLGKAYQFAGSVFEKESLPALLLTTVYKPCHSARFDSSLLTFYFNIFLSIISIF